MKTSINLTLVIALFGLMATTGCMTGPCGEWSEFDRDTRKCEEIREQYYGRYIGTETNVSNGFSQLVHMDIEEFPGNERRLILDEQSGGYLELSSKSSFNMPRQAFTNSHGTFILTGSGTISASKLSMSYRFESLTGDVYSYHFEGSK